MEPQVAVQKTNEPTNKLAAGATGAAAVGAIIAGVFAAYGNDAVMEILNMVPGMGPALKTLIVMAINGVAVYYAGERAGRFAGYNVLDKPNVPLQPAPHP